MFFESEQFKSFGKLVVMLLLPVIILSLSLVVVTNVHDVYSYDMENHDSIEELELGVDSNRLANNISRYLTGDTDQVRTYYKSEKGYDPGIEYDILTEEDYAHLDAIRKISKLLEAVAVVSIVVYAVVLFLAMRAADYGYKARIRRQFMWGLAITMALLIISVIFTLLPYFDSVLSALGVGFGNQGMLGFLFGNRVFKEITVIASMLGVLMSVFAMWVTWQCTKPRKINRRLV